MSGPDRLDYQLSVDQAQDGRWRVHYQDLIRDQGIMAFTVTEERAHEIAHYLLDTRDVTPFEGLLWGIQAIMVGQAMDQAQDGRA